MSSLTRTRLRLCACAGAMAMAIAAGAAHAQTAPSDAAPPPVSAVRDPSDPWEGMNRRFFALNTYLDRVAFRPLSVGYKRITPRPIRAGLHNAFANLGEPLVAVNDLLQGRLSDFGRSTGRFVANSTVGLAGLVDVAARGGVPHHDNDFGLTLARVGRVKPGPYLFIPLRGPTTLRDGVGQGVDVALNPFTWIGYPHDTDVGIGSVVIGGLDARASADKDLKRLADMSTDEYATLRSVYLQNRQSQVTGKAADVNALPSFDDPGAPQAGAPAAPGSVSPTGAPAMPATALPGEAGALPHPAGSGSESPAAPPAPASATPSPPTS